ncbi:MAG: glutamine hydrolyzing CTP synthase [Phycisphaerales bacterium]
MPTRSDRARWIDEMPAPAPPTDRGQRDADESGRSRLLSSVAESTTETEFYSPIPAGYRKGYHKYVIVLGTVMSGLGKGIFASSVAKMLADKGLCVAPIKMEGYLNIDSGTLNPYRHGEVFVLDDGTECDMDLGTYERMLDQDLSRLNFTTSGQVFREVLDREREGRYLGRDVQWIPHVTGEVKRKLRELAAHGNGKRPADAVIVEVGGTVGDYENSFYIEALRELAFEEGPGSSCFVALTYVIEPKTLGEQKSKAAQLGIKRLMEAGIQPHIIACRASKPVNATVMQKIAMFSNVPLRRMFSMHDRESIYTIPEEMRQEGLDREVLSVLNLHERIDYAHEDRAREKWAGFVRMLTAQRRRNITIGLTGKYAGLRDAYASIDKALEHCGAHLGCSIDLRWIDTSNLDDASAAVALRGGGGEGPGGEPLDGVIVPGGFGKRGIEGKIACARYCRENGVPYLGICLGMQVAVIEFARNVCGLDGANSTEFDTPALRTGFPVISELPEQKQVEGLGGTMRLGAQDVLIKPQSLAHFLYGGRVSVRERFRHRYEVDPTFVARLEQAGMIFSGRHPKYPIMQIMELPGGMGGTPSQAGASAAVAHPFFIGGQFHPELTSRPLRPQPLFLGLVAAALRAKYGKAAEDDPAVARWLRSAPALAAPVS